MLSNFRERDTIPDGFLETTNGDHDAAWLVALTTNEAIMAIGTAMRFIRVSGRKPCEADLPMLERAGLSAWEVALFEIAADQAASEVMRLGAVAAWNEQQVAARGMIKQLARNLLLDF